MVLLPFSEDALFEHQHADFEAMPDEVSAAAHWRPVRIHRSGLLHEQPKTAFLMGLSAGTMGAGLGGAAGAGLAAWGSYKACKSWKKCDEGPCSNCSTGCKDDCLGACAKMSFAGAAIGGGLGGGLGSKLGTKYEASKAQTAAPGGGAMPASYGPLDEWNTAPVFALLNKQGPAGVDRPLGRWRNRNRKHAEYFDVDVEETDEVTTPSFL